MVDNAGGLGPAFLIGQFDGILGLAFERISVDGIPPVFDDFVNAGLLSSNVFGFYFDSTGNAGELEIGGVDPAHYSSHLRMELNKFNTQSEIVIKSMIEGSNKKVEKSNRLMSENIESQEDRLKKRMEQRSRSKKKLTPFD
jgi:hypothetical protein